MTEELSSFHLCPLLDGVYLQWEISSFLEPNPCCPPIPGLGLLFFAAPMNGYPAAPFLR